MLFSQLALIALIVLAMVTGYIPWWLGAVALLAWGAAKLVMRSIIGQLEQRALETARLTGSHFQLHSVVPEGDSRDPEPGFWVDVTIDPPHPTTEWYPRRLEFFDHAPDPPCTCAVDDCQVWRGDTFVSCGTEAVTGQGRVRLLVRTPPDTSSVVVSHGEERLGTVSLRKC